MPFIPTSVDGARDLSSESNGVHQFVHGSGRFEKLSLQLRRQRVPLHDRRRAETSQNFLLVANEDCFTGTTPAPV